MSAGERLEAGGTARHTAGSGRPVAGAHRRASSRATRWLWTAIWSSCRLLSVASCRDDVGIPRESIPFSSLELVGACPLDPLLRRIELSALPLVGEVALRPDDFIEEAHATVGKLLTHSSFYSIVSEYVPEAHEHRSFGAIVEADRLDGRPQRWTAGLETEALRHVWTGGDRSEDEDLLVVMLIDQAVEAEEGDGSVAGSRDVVDRWGTSRADVLVAATELLRATDIVSVVGFGDMIVDLRHASATRDRAATAAAIRSVSARRRAGTPLVDALERTLADVISDPTHGATSAAVVLVTDGLATGETSASSARLDEVVRAYESRVRSVGSVEFPSPVPVIVVQHPSVFSNRSSSAGQPQRRSPELLRVACRTGGDYLHVSPGATFHYPNEIDVLVGNRVRGAWKLAVRLDLGDEELLRGLGYFIVVGLRLTLVDYTFGDDRSFRSDPDGTSDDRLWFPPR